MAAIGCVIDDCQRAAPNGRYCGVHASRRRRHGDPLKVVHAHPPFSASLEDRLAQFTDRSGGTDACWPYQGDTSNSIGYGRMMFQGEKDGAHRWAWRSVNGAIPEGMVIRHDCDNPSCCNPRHLSVGTSMDNCADSISRGRRLARILASEDEAVAQRLDAGESIASVARSFGATTSSVYWSIRRRAKATL